MSKTRNQRSHFVCQFCGYDSPRWQGKCPSCGEWNGFVEEKITVPAAGAPSLGWKSQSVPVPLNEINVDQSPRLHTVSPEFDRVLGGGIVSGSVVLVGGDPGIGKSTLLLQEAAALGSGQFKVLYVTGEESARQTKLRADRLGVHSDSLYILAETELDAALKAIERLVPSLVVVTPSRPFIHPI